MLPDRKERLMAQLRAIENALSPENITCDGEASDSWIKSQYRTLNGLREEIIKELGYEPTFKEIWG